MSEPAGASAADVAAALLSTPTPAAGLTLGVLPAGIQYGVVQAVDTTELPWTVSVTLAGSNTQIDNVGYLVSGYTPTPGDNVAIIVSGSDHLVIGSQGPQAGPGGGSGGGSGGPGGDSPADIVFRPDGINSNLLTLKNDAAANEGLTIDGQAGQVVLTPSNGGQLNAIASSIAIEGTAGAGIASDGPVSLDAGTTLEMTASQVVFSALNQAPVISELDPSDFAFWWDATPGATVLNFTGKDALGAEVDLTLGQAVIGGSSGIPIGAIFMFPKTIVDANWLLCNGATYNTSTYPDLFTFLGSNVTPDLRDRIPMGAHTTVSMGSTAGSTTHALTTAELASHGHSHNHAAGAHTHSHNHAGLSHSHSHSHGPATGANFIVAGGVASVFQGTGATAWGTSSTTDTDATTASPTTDTDASTGAGNTGTDATTAGSGTAHSILNPVLGVGFYIRSL